MVIYHPDPSSVRGPLYQIDFINECKGKHFSPAKRKVRFKFGIASVQALHQGKTGMECRGREHDISVTWSLASGKRSVVADNKQVYASQGKITDTKFEATWEVPGGHRMKLVAHAGAIMSKSDFHQFDLFYNGISFFNMFRLSELGTETMRHMAAAGHLSHPSYSRSTSMPEQGHDPYGGGYDGGYDNPNYNYDDGANAGNGGGGNGGGKRGFIRKIMRHASIGALRAPSTPDPGYNNNHHHHYSEDFHAPPPQVPWGAERSPSVRRMSAPPLRVPPARSASMPDIYHHGGPPGLPQLPPPPPPPTPQQQHQMIPAFAHHAPPTPPTPQGHYDPYAAHRPNNAMPVQSGYQNYTY